nr:putative Gag-polypeptide of LTR copia-type [Tanacetum cinerariifolium]
MPLSDYYHKLNLLWQQFDALTSLHASSCTAKKEIKKHSQLIKLMQFLMGLDDVYLPIRSNILTRDPLPSVKYAFAIISGEESHRGVVSNSTPSKPHATAFASKGFDNKKTSSGPNPNLKCTNCLKTGHTVERCFKLVGYPPNYKKPNGQASKGLSPVSGLQKKEIMEIGNESGSLYLFNVDSALNCKTPADCPASICYVSENLWHQRLGHLVDQVLNALKTKLLFDTNPTTSPCEVCHKTKQTKEPFPLRDHKSHNGGELIHLDLWGPYKSLRKSLSLILELS